MAILLGFSLGYILAIPPGPLGLAAIRYGSQRRPAAVAALAAGAGLLDVGYCLLAMWASGGLLSVMIPSLAHGQASSFVVGAQLVVCIAMIIAGIVLMLVSKKAGRGQQNDASAVWARRLGVGAPFLPFLAGLGFALTNIASPTFLPALMVMSGSIRSAGLLGSTSSDVLGFSLGFGIGNALWLITLGLLVHRFHDTFARRVLPHLRMVMGLFLTGIGLYYALTILSIA